MINVELPNYDFRMIKNPVAAKIPLAKCVIIMVVIFVGAVLSVTMQIRYLQYIEEDNYSGCWLMFPFKVGFGYWLSYEIVQMFAPMAILIVVYTLAALQLAAHQKNFIKIAVQSEENVKRVRQDREIVTMFIVIVTIFFLLNAPYCCFIVAASYTMLFDIKSWDPYAGNTAQIVLFALSSISTVVNPFVYAKMHKDVAEALKGLFYRVKRIPESACMPTLHDASKAPIPSRVTIEMKKDIETASRSVCQNTKLARHKSL